MPDQKPFEDSCEDVSRLAGNLEKLGNMPAPYCSIETATVKKIAAVVQAHARKLREERDLTDPVAGAADEPEE